MHSSSLDFSKKKKKKKKMYKDLQYWITMKRTSISISDRGSFEKDVTADHPVPMLPFITNSPHPLPPCNQENSNKLFLQIQDREIHLRKVISEVKTECESLLSFYFPHYMYSFYYHNFTLFTATNHWPIQFLLQVCKWERELEEDNFICKKCGHLKNTVVTPSLNIPPPPMSPSVAIFG